MTIIDKIYDLTYNEILTPYNLIDNLKLDNYHEIKYAKNNDGIIAEVICDVSQTRTSFYYQFNFDNFLNEIYYFEGNVKEYLFNRSAELSNLRSKFINTENCV
ncbi:hypothetical protein [Clostridium cylindrosporum]|uniref:Uncharacterized protein n=1 Tax=Clostridium cylindrosporum DSM 605 TaxID=1121307 RepID=A0A0J8DFE2_CLOCY|nr:hypothetical protein [Clostridium cylindrosporum]KMT22969.1 hypothetical protein CLCY_7c00160 [Clostridium cylindrosporum DSM 605]